MVQTTPRAVQDDVQTVIPDACLHLPPGAHFGAGGRLLGSSNSRPRLWHLQGIFLQCETT